MTEIMREIDKATDVIAKLLQRKTLPSEVRMELNYAQEILLAILTS